MNERHGLGTLFARWQSLSRLHFFVAFLFVAFCPLALASRRPLETAIVLLISARVFYLIGKHFSQSARIAMVGAVGEDDVAAALQQLPSGWKIERNIPFDGGDIDFLLTSPQNKIFLLEAKAHSGIVFYDGIRLSRKVRGKHVPFERDILSKIKQQAVLVRTERKLSFVNAVVVFTRAEVQVSAAEIAFVRVIPIKDLLQVLKEETNPPASKVVLRTNLKKIAENRNIAGDKATLGKENITEMRNHAKKQLASQSEHIKRLARAAGIAPLNRNYSIRLHDCWSCKKQIFVLDWPGHQKWDIRMPPQPVPATLQKKHSQVTGEDHWANTCFICGQTQGDYYVFEEQTPYRWHTAKKTLEADCCEVSNAFSDASG